MGEDYSWLLYVAGLVAFVALWRYLLRLAVIVIALGTSYHVLIDSSYDLVARIIAVAIIAGIAGALYRWTIPGHQPSSDSKGSKSRPRSDTLSARTPCSQCGTTGRVYCSHSGFSTGRDGWCYDCNGTGLKKCFSCGGSGYH